jgi:hypothetical protein
MTVACAAAAEAMRYKGTGWDMFLVENYFRVPRNVAVASARAKLSGKGPLMDEIAIRIEEKGLIKEYDVEEAKRKVAEDEQGIFPVEIEIYRSTKKIESYSTKSSHGEVIIPRLPIFSKN